MMEKERGQYRVKDIERDLRLKYGHKRVEIVTGHQCAIGHEGDQKEERDCN